MLYIVLDQCFCWFTAIGMQLAIMSKQDIYNHSCPKRFFLGYINVFL